MKYDVINEGSGKFGKSQDRRKTGREDLRGSNRDNKFAFFDSKTYGALAFGGD